MLLLLQLSEATHVIIIIICHHPLFCCMDASVFWHFHPYILHYLK